MMRKVQLEELDKRKAFDLERHQFNLQRSAIETELSKLKTELGQRKAEYDQRLSENMELSESLNKTKQSVSKEADGLAQQRRRLEQTLERDAEDLRQQKQQADLILEDLTRRQTEFEQDKVLQQARLSKWEDELKRQDKKFRQQLAELESNKVALQKQQDRNADLEK